MLHKRVGRYESRGIDPALFAESAHKPSNLDSIGGMCICVVIMLPNLEWSHDSTGDAVRYF